MTETEPRETVSSYEGFDFRRLWAGRDAVTRLESTLIRDALEGTHLDRLLEAGTGFGRLSPVLAGLAKEYVGVDLDATQLSSVRERVLAGRGSNPDLVAKANLFHLPFAAKSFRAVISVRVYHHIRDPGAFLAEAARVLAPGGLLLLSYNPKPTIATLEHDLRGVLRGRPTRLTFDRSDSVECRSEPFPIVVPSRARVLQDVRDAGFDVVRELGEGPERLARWFPIGSTGGAASSFPSSFLFPTRFLLARRSGEGPGPIPPLEQILSCPRCQAPFGPRRLTGAWLTECAACGGSVELRDGILFAEYIPPAADRRSVSNL